jgi:murein DD-endopeptidase MepM/ murein hydrolase activator NlpD
MSMPSSKNGASNEVPDGLKGTGAAARRAGGLLIGLLTVFVTIGLVAASVTAGPGENWASIPSSATPTMPIASARVTTAAAPSTVPTSTMLPATTATHTPDLTATSSPSPTGQATLPPAPVQVPATSTELVIGYSVEGRPIIAHRVGNGAIKVALVGNIHGAYEANTHLLARQLLEHFQTHPDQVPSNVSLWFVPTMNPDGLETGHRWNANGVDLNRNADTDLDGCARNDWSPDTHGPDGQHPGAGGSYPFSEPEARAVRDFLADASVAVFYHSAAKAIFVDTCQRHIPTARLAEAVSRGSGYPVPEAGWAGYPVTGDFGDYLAGEGVAAVTVELSNHQDLEFQRNLDGVHSLLNAVEEIVSAEATVVGAEYIPLALDTTGKMQFAANTFMHPLALTVVDRTAYLLDSGRILALSLDRAEAPEVILASGDYVDKVRVLELLDLTSAGTELRALDRAGDVYRYDTASGSWVLERYDRPVRDTYDHYLVALDSFRDTNYLLETTHEQVWRFTSGELGAAWVKLPQSRDVDLSANDAALYVLTRNLNSPTASLFYFRGGQPIAEFAPNVEIVHPRQVAAASEIVYVLDRAGRRLLALQPNTGELLALHQFTDRTAVSAVWADPTGKQVILAGRDALYLLGQPEIQTVIEGGPSLEGPQPHDLVLLQTMGGLSSPIRGATITKRDFQMPGAPRHYRLGVHEGIDFYGHTVGVPVNRRTPVRAVADGVVVRALVDYEPLTAAQADAWVAQSVSLGYTPPDVLDGYRGRQIWIDHGNGIMSRYAHLSSIEPGIVEGVQVTREQVIATVGNSGTPGSLNSQTYDVHLHLELWVGDHFVGQFLRPIEAREWLERILR